MLIFKIIFTLFYAFSFHVTLSRQKCFILIQHTLVTSGLKKRQASLLFPQGNSVPWKRSFPEISRHHFWKKISSLSNSTKPPSCLKNNIRLLGSGSSFWKFQIQIKSRFFLLRSVLSLFSRSFFFALSRSFFFALSRSFFASRLRARKREKSAGAHLCK